MSTYSSAIIGAAEVSRSAGQPMPKLYIENSGNEPQLGFGSRGQEGYVSLLFDRINNRVAFSDAATIPSNSVALGINQNIASTVSDIIALGNNINIPYDHWKESALAIGNNIQISPRRGIAIGFNLGLNESGDGYANSQGIMIGQDSYYIALPIVVSGTANTTIKAGEPLKGNIQKRDTAFTASTTGAVGINLHDVELDANGKGNATLVIAGCVDLLKLDSTVKANVTTALADEGQALDRIIFVEGSAI